ncbi:MAG: FixH family protein [Chlorobia bacterium]|nr:FixH family protein [Fimbriimonadaceae bacterium]
MLYRLMLFALASSALAAPANAQNPTAKAGKYVVELRIPEEGLFAGEEIDIEFRVMDSTKNDEILGMAGVPNVKVEAVITMPSMEGMPEAKPKVHAEGVPGDYGIESFFPHGGDYKIELALTSPNEPTFKVAFTVDVKDEKPAKGKPKPYVLQIVDGKGAKAGQPFNLKLRIQDVKSKLTVKAFDMAHEMYFHLLLASKDFQWFLHEHPKMAPDGTWTVPITFPASGEYFLYSDVAPAGKGSQILIASIKVDGPKPSWTTSWKIGTSGQDRGIQGSISSFGGDYPVAKMTTLVLKITDSTGKPVGDTVPWLGAAGHLMIFSQDGHTVVHSHPAHGEENARLVKQGEMRFSGRFPKPGIYRIFAQFQRQGKIHTIPFTIEVKP